MKNLAISLVVLSVTLSFAGCKTADQRKTPPVQSQTQAAQAQRTDLACTKCGCSKFEAQSDASSVCRMCGHNASDHTRK